MALDDDESRDASHCIQQMKNTSAARGRLRLIHVFTFFMSRRKLAFAGDFL